MVSVTGSVTWISHCSSVIGKTRIPGDNGMRSTPIATSREEPREAERGLAQRRKKMPLPFQGAGQGTDPPIHRQVRKDDREPGEQERIRWGFTQGCRVPWWISALRNIFGSKEKDTSASRPLPQRLYNLDGIIGALITDVERQSISNRHKYLQAIADLESVSFI